jgi:hypothetical protein
MGGVFVMTGPQPAFAKASAWHASRSARSMVADAVQRNPSPMAVSLLTGKITGYLVNFGRFDGRDCEESPVPRRFLDQIPTKDIREFQKQNRDQLCNIRDFRNA